MIIYTYVYVYMYIYIYMFVVRVSTSNDYSNKRETHEKPNIPTCPDDFLALFTASSGSV